MRRLAGVLLVLLALLGMPGGPPPATAKVIVKLATLAPVGSSYHDILLELGREWERTSGGEVELRVYAGGVAGDEPDVVRKMRVGQLQAAMLNALGGLPAIDPGFRALNLLLTFRDAREVDHALAAMRTTLDDLLARHGFQALAWFDAGWLYLFSRRAAPTPDALRPQRLFVWAGADEVAAALRDCGQSVITLPATDLHTAIQSGLVDAMTLPPLFALANQWFAALGHMTAIPWAPLIGAVVGSERVWSRLPPAQRRALAEATAAAVARMQPLLRADTVRAIEVMRTHGLVVVEPGPAEIELWRRDAEACFRPPVGAFIDARLRGELERVLQAFRRGG